MLILDFGIDNQFLSIIGATVGATEQHRAAHIWKEIHGEADSSTGGTERCQEMQSGMEHERASQSSSRYHG